MATGPLPSSGWNLHKTKDAIFAHLNEYGITMNLAKQLLSLDESDGITKENGLNLITLMNTEITETNVLTSPLVFGGVYCSNRNGRDRGGNGVSGRPSCPHS